MQPIRHIKSLQAFRVVARTQNLTHAAQRMNVSQSSVSYHIKKLEDEIGTLLFDRSSDGLRLTDKGRCLAEHVERGLRTIRAGLDEVGSVPRLVRLAVLPMFASRWLSGRLGSFWEEHPGLELAFQSHDNNYVSMKAPEDFADLGIQWGRGGWPGFTAVPLWTERIVIVCSADFLKRHTVEHPTDLMTCPLLHVDDYSMWEEWFATVGMKFRATQRQTTLVDRHFQLASTANGLGVSLFAESMVQSELRSGSLVNPFRCSYPTGFAYHLVIPDRSALGASAQAFKTWLLGLCENTEPCLRSS